MHLPRSEFLGALLWHLVFLTKVICCSVSILDRKRSLVWCLLKFVLIQVAVRDTRGSKSEDEPPPMWFRSYMEKVRCIFFLFWSIKNLHPPPADTMQTLTVQRWGGQRGGGEDVQRLFRSMLHPQVIWRAPRSQWTERRSSWPPTRPIHLKWTTHLHPQLQQLQQTHLWRSLQVQVGWSFRQWILSKYLCFVIYFFLCVYFFRSFILFCLSVCPSCILCEMCRHSHDPSHSLVRTKTPLSIPEHGMSGELR